VGPFAYRDGNGQWQRIGNDWFWPVGADDWFPPNWPENATQEDRDTFGVAEIVREPEPTGPEVKYCALAPELADVSGLPHETWLVDLWTREATVAEMKRRVAQYASNVMLGPLPVPDMLPDQEFLARVDVAAQVKAIYLGLGARDAIVASAPMSITFEDESYPKQKVTLATPEQILELGNRINSFPLTCDLALIQANDGIDAIYDANGDVAAIFAFEYFSLFPPVIATPAPLSLAIQEAS
jgi:hypothetical protein